MHTLSIFQAIMIALGAIAVLATPMSGQSLARHPSPPPSSRDSPPPQRYVKTYRIIPYEDPPSHTPASNSDRPSGSSESQAGHAPSDVRLAIPASSSKSDHRVDSILIFEGQFEQPSTQSGIEQLIKSNLVPGTLFHLHSLLGAYQPEPCWGDPVLTYTYRGHPLQFFLPVWVEKRVWIQPDGIHEDVLSVSYLQPGGRSLGDNVPAYHSYDITWANPQALNSITWGTPYVPPTKQSVAFYGPVWAVPIMRGEADGKPQDLKFFIPNDPSKRPTIPPDLRTGQLFRVQRVANSKPPPSFGDAHHDHKLVYNPVRILRVKDSSRDYFMLPDVKPGHDENSATP
jgi:hypothetical protein